MNKSRAMFPLAAMCRVLGLSPSGCYDWLTRPPSDRARRDIELQGKILLSWGGSGETYGCPRIHAELRAAGERVSRKRVARLMRDLGIQGVTRRRFKTMTTRKDAKARPAPDLVNRNFSADGPDQLWVADITHVPTWAGWLYLAVVLDAWSRRIVGWAMAPHMRAEPNLSRARWRWRSRTGSPRGGWCIIPTGGSHVHLAGNLRPQSLPRSRASLQSMKSSPFFEPVVVAPTTDRPACWAAHPRRSRENCGETLHGEATSSIGPRPLRRSASETSLRSSLRGELRQYVQDRLGGLIEMVRPCRAPLCATPVAVADDRRWAVSWSPERANRLRVDFPDESPCVYLRRSTFRAAVRGLLTACLRNGRYGCLELAPEDGARRSFTPRSLGEGFGHWGRRPDPGAGQFGDRNAGRRTSRFTMRSTSPALRSPGPRTVQHTVPPSGTRSLRRRDPARAPLSGDFSTHGFASIPCRLLLRPAEPVAARHERKHQRPVETVFPQRH